MIWMVFVVSILVVYGITNILVFGTIFDGVKTSFRNWISNLKKKNTATIDDLADYEKYEKLVRNNYNKFMAFEEYQDLLTGMENPSDSLIMNFERSRDAVLKLIQEYKHSRLRTGLIWFSEKIDKLFQCMMCTGFWVGLIFAILTFILDINLFGVPIVLVQEGAALVLNLFLLACMFSGTCWIINSVVDLLVVKKDQMEEFENYEGD